MNRQTVSIICLIALSINGLPGCMLRRPGFHFGGDDAHLRSLASQTQYQDVHEAAVGLPAGISGPPRLLTDLTPADFWPMTPEESVQFAISNSTVLRDLGGTVLQSPTRIRSINDPALVETNPRFGVHRALAAFDAEFSTRAFFEKNDRALNNRIVGLGTQIFQQDYLSWQSEVTKRSMTGGRYTYRNTWEYDANNSMDNIFGSAWTTLMDFEARQPLLQGSGVQFNQIAGPDATPGEANGVRIARLNTDVSLTEYQIALRDLVSNVENAYWDLYFAYRDLEAKIAARDEALLTWRRFQAQRQTNIGEAADEAQAREQYFRFQEEVQNALNGRLVEGTEVNNGSSGGSFRGTLGVLMAERRLRLAMGLPINDGRIIRPAYDPKMVRVVFNWDELLGEALTRRAELQRQRTIIRRSELELLASRNFLLPRLDAFGRYRFRGFGKDLIDTRKTSGQLLDMNNSPIDRLSFDNAYQDLTTGDFQEWQLGFEFSMPVGFRRAHAAVRHAQLQLVRERAIMTEQERQLVYDLSNVYSEVYRAFEVMQTAYNRRIAAQENYETLNAQFLNNLQTNANLLLDSQRRLADAESRFYRAQVDYMLAIKNVHYEKGSLLDYNEVYLVGEPTAPDKDAGAARRWLRGKPFDYLLTRPIKTDKGRGDASPENVSAPPQTLASGNPLTAQQGSVDGNAIPRDGLPMVRLPHVALPRLDLPTLENMTLPPGPTSPAQVLPPPAPARIAQPPVRTAPGHPTRTALVPPTGTQAPSGITQAPSKVTQAPSTATQAPSKVAQAPGDSRSVTGAANRAQGSRANTGPGSTAVAANQRNRVQLPFRTKESSSAPTAATTARPSSTGAQPSSTGARPAYRYPNMNPDQQLAGGLPPNGQGEVAANRSVNPREDRNRGSKRPQPLPRPTSPTVAGSSTSGQLAAGGSQVGDSQVGDSQVGGSPVVRPARLPRLPVRPQDQPADEGPLVDLAARPATPPESLASQSLPTTDEIRSRLRPSKAMVAGSPNFPMPLAETPDSFDRLSIFGGQQQDGKPASDRGSVADATRSRLQPAQAAATPALSGLRQPQQPATPAPRDKTPDAFDRLSTFRGEQPTRTPAVDQTPVADASRSRLQPAQAAATPALSGLRQPQQPATPAPREKTPDAFDRLSTFRGERPAGTPAVDQTPVADASRSRLQPAQAAATPTLSGLRQPEQPATPAPREKTPDAFDRLSTFRGERPAGTPAVAQTPVADASRSRLQPAQAAATPALSGLPRSIVPSRAVPEKASEKAPAATFDRLPIFGVAPPKPAAPIVAAPAGAIPGRSPRTGTNPAEPLATLRPSGDLTSPARASVSPAASRPETSQAGSLGNYVSAAPASSAAPIVDAPTPPAQPGKPNRFFRLLFGSDEQSESEATAPASAELPADDVDSDETRADAANADSGSANSGLQPLYRLPRIDEGERRAAPIVEPTWPTMQPAAPTKHPAASTRQPAASASQPVARPAAPIVEPTWPTIQPAAPTRQPAAPIVLPAGSFQFDRSPTTGW